MVLVPSGEVDLLKGVNCAFRRDALVAVGFDQRLARRRRPSSLGSCDLPRSSPQEAGKFFTTRSSLSITFLVSERRGTTATLYDPRQLHIDATHNGFLVIWETSGCPLVQVRYSVHARDHW